LENKVIVITGASSGIGRACAHEFAKSGVKLVLASRNVDELNKLAEKLREKSAEPMVVKTDVSSSEDCKALIDKSLKAFGKIDILINNAGISQRSLAAETDMEVNKKLMGINFFGVVEVTKYALESMVKNKGGHIVVISSIVGKFGFPLRSGYAASKHALHGYFESLRAEISKDNINVTIVCPGRIKTNISVNALTKDGSKHNKMDQGQAEGVSAEKCARKIIKAINSNKKEVFIGGKEIVFVKLRKYFPGLFYKIIRKIEPL